MITADMIQTCINNMDDYCITIGVDTAKRMLGDEDLRFRLGEYYPPGVHNSLDTDDCDVMADVFAQIILHVDRWPRYRDHNTAYAAQFVAALRNAESLGDVTVQAGF